MSDRRFSDPSSSKRGRRMQGERRVITMLFCDVTGSTAMAENLDPEEWAEIMNEAFEFMVSPIYRYEGTVARLMGDGFLAFFGAPVAHEDDPQRAIMAGLDILQDITPFREEIREEYGLEFDVRVGINTGPVVVGDIGTDRTLEYTAMGDAINLAARMEETAEPGTIQITADTHRLVAPLFDFESLGAMEIKGKDEPTETYRVLGRKHRPGRLRGIQGLEAPIIGRQMELEQLKATFHDLRNGKGQIVMLIGEAGLGKSRLISEIKGLFQQTDGDQISWSESAGIPYETNRPYSLFHQRMINDFGLGPDDPPEIAREKIAKGLQNLPPGSPVPAIREAVETLLAVEEGGEKSQLEAEALKRELFEAVTQSWKNSAEQTPMVTVFDDLHWSDPASIELLSHLLPLVQDVPLLILCAMRPVRQSAGWQLVELANSEFAGHYQEFNLQPLSEKDSDALIDSLLSIAELPGEMRRLILKKTEGNPFFVEEVIRTLIDLDIVKRDESGLRWQATQPIEHIDIPDNLQSLLISRIDRLEQETKLTLQMASVIGRSFYYRILDEIADRIKELSTRLEALQQADLIQESAQIPELEYIFRHELTRDATYETILHRQRRRYHQRVGEAIEDLYPERLADEAHRLAYHFHQAGDRERALIYYTMAGDRAARLYANAEAITYYEHALAFVDETGDHGQIRHLYISRGRVYEVSGQYDEAMDNYRELEQVGRKREDFTLELEGLVAQATLRSTYTDKFDPEEAAVLSKKALKLAQDHKNPQAEAKIYWNMMMATHFANDSTEKAIEYGERSLAIAKEFDLKEQLAYTLHDLSRPYFAIGRVERSYDVLREAGELFRELGNLPMLADNKATLAGGLGFMGQLKEALKLAEEAWEVSQVTGSLWGQAYSLNTIAGLYFELGRVDEALEAWERSLELAKSANFTVALLSIREFLALAYTFLGDHKQSISLGEQILSLSAELDL
ncbi:MAG: adenylate/guanylate cyclase domain-containing protein, partial [Chloroflexota bacterium]